MRLTRRRERAGAAAAAAADAPPPFRFFQLSCERLCESVSERVSAPGGCCPLLTELLCPLLSINLRAGLR